MDGEIDISDHNDETLFVNNPKKTTCLIWWTEDPVLGKSWAQFAILHTSVPFSTYNQRHILKNLYTLTEYLMTARSFDLID